MQNVSVGDLRKIKELNKGRKTWSKIQSKHYDLTAFGNLVLVGIFINDTLLVTLYNYTSMDTHQRFIKGL